MVIEVLKKIFTVEVSTKLQTNHHILPHKIPKFAPSAAMISQADTEIGLTMTHDFM